MAPSKFYKQYSEMIDMLEHGNLELTEQQLNNDQGEVEDNVEKAKHKQEHLHHLHRS